MYKLLNRLPSKQDLFRVLNNPDIQRLFVWLAITALSAITIITVISGVILFTQNVQP